MSKRSIQRLQILNLEQIQSLSSKALLNFFSDMSCNEMTKNFTCQCYLMPEKCQDKFTSFGHDTKAKSNMLTHLNNHIKQLTQEATGKRCDFKMIWFLINYFKIVSFNFFILFLFILFFFFIYSDPESKYRFIFTAEPVHVRNRKLSSKFHLFISMDWFLIVN